MPTLPSGGDPQDFKAIAFLELGLGPLPAMQRDSVVFHQGCGRDQFMSLDQILDGRAFFALDRLAIDQNFHRASSA